MADDGSAFLADIDEETLKELDQRLAMAGAQSSLPRDQRAQAATYAAPSLTPGGPARSADFSRSAATALSRPEEPDDGAPLAGESGTMDFLAELEQEVAARRQQGAAPRDGNDQAEQLHAALSRIFAFLNQISRYANQLEPEISRSYRLDAQTEYAGLRWHGAFVDHRKQDMSENARLSHVSFRVRLVAAQPIKLVRRWDQLEALKRDLSILDLRIVDDAVFAQKPEQEFIKLQLLPDFPVQMNFKGNYAAQRIELLCRNLEGFCISAFVLDANQVTQPLLEELGRFLLSRSKVLPSALRRVNYVPPAAKKP